jgi:hypothetical protein
MITTVLKGIGHNGLMFIIVFLLPGCLDLSSGWGWKRFKMPQPMSILEIISILTKGNITLLHFTS